LILKKFAIHNITLEYMLQFVYNKKKTRSDKVDSYNTLNEIFVNLYQNVMDIEEKALITSEFKDISVNDLHILEAIGTEAPRNMSAVAKTLAVTVGTLTIAINGLVKKGYVHRARSEEDRRVVLISLTEIGKKAHVHHMRFHEEMIQDTLKDLSEEETEILTKSLTNLAEFFKKF